MAEAVEIGCINKDNRNDPYTSITHVGGMHGGKRWIETLDAAIGYIESGTYTFYVNKGLGGLVRVIIGISPRQNKYLKTDADATLSNNLLSLAECPL